MYDIFVDKLKIYRKCIAKNLGNSYPEFYQHLGLTPAEIEVARSNNNQNAEGAMLELWNKLVY